MRLVTKGLLLLLVPTVAQIGLLAGFCILQRETEYAYPRRAAQDIALIDGTTRYFLDDFAILSDIRDYLVWKVPLEESFSSNVEAFRNEAGMIKDNYLNFTQRRRPLLPPPWEQDLDAIKKDFDHRAVWLDSITKPTERAVGLIKESQLKASGTQLSAEGVAWFRAALVHLDNIVAIDEISGSDPFRSSHERSFYKGLEEVTSLFDLLALLSVCAFFGSNISKRLSTILDNIEKFGRGDEPSGIVSGADEIAKIDATFKDLFKNLQETMFPHKSMMEHSQDLICLLDAHGRVLNMSNSSIPLLGYSPAELSGVGITHLVTTDLQSLTFEKFLKLTGGEDVPPFESQFVRDDKTIVDVLLSATWSAKDGVVFCVAHDITQTKATERLQQDVVHMVSHDLKTPLNAISNFHELAENGVYGELAPKSLEQIKRAKRSTERMLTLIKDLLDIERMKSGMLQLELQPVSLDTAIEQAIESVENLAERNFISIETVSTNLIIVADGARLIQIIINLLSNAIKFSPPHSKIQITVKRDQDYIALLVADNGRGIPEEFQKTIFDRFSQTQASDATTHGGSGLGLAICKALIELHGGDIDVTSTVGKGSVFRVRIPFIDRQ
jgi:PAS domain S-box-containing protein